LDFFQYQITKYVSRAKKKNGLEDLKKAQHFLEKYIEVVEAECTPEVKSGQFVDQMPIPRPFTPNFLLVGNANGEDSYLCCSCGTKVVIVAGADPEFYHGNCPRKSPSQES
jgi:hypothetical protein